MVDEPGGEVRLLKDLDGCEIYNTTSGVPWNCRPYSGIILDELAAQDMCCPAWQRTTRISTQATKQNLT
ncbi:MAG: hypothetical protein ACLURV_01615 [Gallintestinimicrobium sp.]